jgi:hypothetical protein
VDTLSVSSETKRTECSGVRLHQLGYWVPDHAAEKARLAGLGYKPFASSEPGLLIAQGAGNLRVEPCDLLRDDPYLYDLYPRDSQYFGEPVLPVG